MRLDTCFILITGLITFTSIIITQHVKNSVRTKNDADFLPVLHRELCTLEPAHNMFMHQAKQYTMTDGLYCPMLQLVLFALQHPNFIILVWSGTALFNFACLLTLVLTNANTQEQLHSKCDELDDTDFYKYFDCSDAREFDCIDAPRKLPNNQEALV